MLLLSLSTSHKIGLGLVALVFVAFALASAFLLPRFRPNFPGPGGVRPFVFGTLLLFAGMMSAVVFLAREPKEAKAGAAEQPKQAPAATVKVSESEFKIALPSTSLKAGTFKLDLTNGGKIAHNLVVTGPQVNKASTPTIGPGKTASLTVTLVKGTYELYCSVPGHKQAGMDVKVTVS